MPTVLRMGRLRIVIFPNDHRSAHVLGQGHEAVFELNCPAGPLSFRENYGFPEHQVQDIRAALQEHIGELCRAWGGIHGPA
jgi:hypothetical protein